MGRRPRAGDERDEMKAPTRSQAEILEALRAGARLERPKGTDRFIIDPRGSGYVPPKASLAVALHALYCVGWVEIAGVEGDITYLGISDEGRAALD
mgnify:CR=1 FL=1